MGVGSVGQSALPDPAFYSSPSTLPQSNVSNVLAQAALQQQELAAQHKAQVAAANVPAPASVPVPVPMPTLTSMIQQGNANAYADISNGTLGASVDTFA